MKRFSINYEVFGKIFWKMLKIQPFNEQFL